MSKRQTLPGLLKIRTKKTPQAIAHWVLNTKGCWSSISFNYFYQELVDLAWKFKDQGIHKGNVVGIMVATSRNWELIHHAVLSLGGIVVGIDPGEASNQLDTQINQCGTDKISLKRAISDTVRQLSSGKETKKYKPFDTLHEEK